MQRAAVRPVPSLIVALLLATLAAIASISFASAQSADTGRVRVMHASPDAPAVDIYVDGAKAVTALAFPKDTGYVTLPAGAHNVKVFVSPSDGTGTPALQADLTIAKGKDYTVLAVGEVGKNTLALLPLEDNNATPAAGNAHVRLIHASPDAPAVDVLVAGTSTRVFSNIAFRSVGAYTPVPAGTYDLNVNVAGTSTTAKTITGLALKERTVYTAVAVGFAGNGTLQVLPLVDANAPAPHAPDAGTGLLTSPGHAATWLAAAGFVLTLFAAGLFGVAALAPRRARN